MKDFSGIYKIVNILNDNFYIGQTINLKKRKKEHFHNLKNNQHHSPYLQNAFNKYGEKNFKFEIILYCEPFELTRYEQELVNRLKPVYNALIECVDSNKGYKQREETIKKLSERMTGENHWNYGKQHSEQTKQRMSESQKGNKNCLGRKVSEESKRKSSESNKGKHNISEETRLRLSESHKGKTLSDEAKRKVSEFNKGIKRGSPSKETKQKMSNAKKGQTLSEEQKKKISESGKQAWIKRKQNKLQPIEEGSTNI
jgi:group I intron endonuclease